MLIIMGLKLNGEEFDGCFDGYSAIDRDIPIPPVKEPTALIHSWILKFQMSLLLDSCLAAYADR